VRVTLSLGLGDSAGEPNTYQFPWAGKFRRQDGPGEPKPWGYKNSGAVPFENTSPRAARRAYPASIRMQRPASLRRLKQEPRRSEASFLGLRI
jgi:hypothetical protein